MALSHMCLQKMKVDYGINPLNDGVAFTPTSNTLGNDSANGLQLKSASSQTLKTYNACVHQMFQDRARVQPEAPAICAWDGQFTYAELDVLSTSLATHLAQHGLGPELYVPICSEKSRWVPVAMLAVLKAGAAFVLLDRTHPIDRLKGMCQTLSAPMVIASERTAEIARQLAPEIFVTGEHYPGQRTTVAVDLNPGHVAYAVFTSGSSGRPKAVAIEHRAFCSGVVPSAAATSMSAESRVLQFSSYAFDSCLMEILTALIVGACVCVPSDEGRTNNLVDEVRRLQPNWAVLTPSVARIVDVADFSMLRTLILAGEAINENDVRKWAPNLSLYVGYGVTEAVVCNVVRRCSVGDVDHANIGFGVGVRCWVVDPDDHDRLVAPGAVGELLLEGPAIARGYIGDPVRTAAAFIDPPYWHCQLQLHHSAFKGARMYKTGDLCAYNPADGSIRYAGRKDDQKKFHGQRLEVAEVEHNVRHLLPNAQNLVVDTVKIDDMESLVAFVLAQTQPSALHAGADEDWLFEPSDDFHAQTRLVQQRLRAAIPEWMIPSAFLPLKYMPFLPSGKIDRRKLQSLTAKMTHQKLHSYSAARMLTAKRAPSTHMEKVAQQLWACVLCVPESDIGLDDNFAELGGTSIHLMKLAGAARQQGVAISIGDVLRRGSLAEMAASFTLAPVEGQTPIQPFSLVPNSEDHDALVRQAMRTCQLQNRRDIEDLYPCTALQEGLMSLTARRPGAYTIALEYELPAKVNIERFQQAWNAVVASNSILRTRFMQSTTGSMYQVVLRTMLPWESDTNAKPSSYHATNWKLGQPLARLCLGQSDGSYRFFFLIHHALTDGWSMPLLLQQVQLTYDGAISPSPHPFNRFIDYIARTRPNYEAFWSRYFDDAQVAAFPSLPSATYTPSPTVKTTFTIQVDSPGKNEFGVPSRLKLAWSILISLYTDSTDTVFGLTVAGRGAPVLGIEDMTGPTIASIPYRLRLQLDDTIVDTLRKVQEDSVAMMPFEQAGLQRISRMGPEAALACSALQSLLVIQPQFYDSPELFRASRDLSELDAFSTYAITLICRQLPGSVEIDATFDPTVVDETQFERMLQQMRHIFQQLNPSQSARAIRDLDITSPEDWADLTVWNRSLPVPVYACAHDLIRKQSELRPGSPAVCAWDGGFTYSEMEKLSSAMAAYLMEHAVGPEVFIPLCFEKSRWTIIAMLAVIKAGGAFILLDPSHPVQRLQRICQDAKAPFVISSERNADLAYKLAPHAVVIGTDWKPKESPNTLSLVLNPAVTPENSIYAVFTSGSTGTPKGATHSHISWCTGAQANCDGLYLEPTSRVFQFAAYAFDVSIADNLLTLVAGGCVCIPKNEDIQGGNLVEAINDLGANWACLTPSVARIINPTKVPNLRKLAFCGEPIAPEVISLWSAHAHLLNVYGPAECAILTTLHRNVRDYKDRNSIAFPISAVCWIVDAQNQQRLAPIGTVGELLVESPIVGHGYLNDPERSAESFIPSNKYPAWLSKFRPGGTCSLYRTGDLVQYTRDGSLRYMGRLGTQIKLRGQRIELGEVEYRLRQCFPEAQEAVAEVIARNQVSGSTALTAFILPKPQDFKMSDERFGTLVAEATARLELLLPGYMVPTIFIPVDQLPYSKSGKLDRKSLRSLAAELSDKYSKSTNAKKVMPVSDEERILCNLFARALRIPSSDISTTHNFLRLGGDSIVAMNLVAMAKDLELVFTVADIFSNPTISSLAKKVEKYTTGVASQIQPFSFLQSGTDRARIKKDAMDQCQINEGQIEDIYPCTPLQEGFISISAKNSGMYIARFEYVIPPQTNLPRFQNAWTQVLFANSILRTRIIHSGDYGTFQVVLRDPADWKAFGTADEQEKHSQSQIMVVGSPLLCLSLAPSDDGSGTHRVLLTIHHSLYDGWSLQLVWQQVRKVYQGQKLIPQSFNYFIRQVVKLEGGEIFWKSQMSDLNAAQFPVLPYIDYSPNPNQSLSHFVTDLPSSKGQYTLATILQLAWAVVLSHYTGSDDVVFGLISDGRSAAIDGIGEMTGPTIATVPVRVLLDLKKTVEDSLLELQHQTVATIPFLQFGLQNIRKINEDTAKACGFQTQLVVQPPSITSGTNLEGLARAVQEDFEDYTGFTSYSFVMLCYMQEASNDLLVSVNYDSAIFQKEEVQRLVEQFHTVLRQLFDRRHDPIGEIEVISKEDAAQLAIWQGQLPSATPEALHDLVLEHCRSRPDAEAVSSWDGQLTYGQLDDSSARLAQYLLTLCRGPESKIAVCLEKSCWSIVAFLAVLRSGCACVVVDPGHPRGRIEQMMRTATPEIMLVSETYQKLVHGLVGRMVCISSSFIGNLPSFGTTLPIVAPSRTAFILFTSGSTGTPKGIIMEHINWSTCIAQIGAELNSTSGTRCLHFASYSFDASIYEIFSTLSFGGCLCIVSEHDRMNNLAGFICQQRVTWALLTPSTVALLQPGDVPFLKTLVVGGEALTDDVVDLWAGKLNLFNAYGPAEGTFCCATGKVPATGWKHGTIGHMVGGHGWIVDRSNHMKLAAIGAVGELIIEGPAVTRGYLNEPEKTAAAYIETPPWLLGFRSKGPQGRLYKTGDLVQYNLDGTIRFSGRIVGQVKLRGQRIELGEVEYHVRKSFPVAVDVVAEVIVPSGEGRTPFLVACVFVGGEQAVDNAVGLFHEPTQLFIERSYEAKLKVSNSIPSYMVPAAFLPLRRLPLSRSGKLNRKQIRDACCSLSLDQIHEYFTEAKVAKRAPSTGIEKTLRQIWARVLNVEESSIGVDDNWMRLGGDSIQAMRVVAQCSAAGLRTSVGALFDGKTIAGMSLKTKHMYLKPALAAEPLNIPFDLTPMQQLFFDTAGLHYNYFNQSPSFRLLEPVSSKTIQQAVRRVVEHHSMLRARFIKASKGQWKQMITDDVDQSYSYRESMIQTRDAAASLLQSDQEGLDIQDGPLLICHLLHCGPENELYLAFTAHHLVVDTASWKILLSDIELLFSDHQPPLPPPSLSFQTWSRLQAEYAEKNLHPPMISPNLAPNVLDDYWEFDVCKNSWEDVIEGGLMLGEQETRALLGDANDAFKTQPVEILHAVLLQAFARVFSDRPVPAVISEGHVREPWDSNLDLSRTIGWFATMWPVDVSVQPGDSLLDIVRKTKDGRRSVTNNGWACFTPCGHYADHADACHKFRPIEILFNCRTGFAESQTSVMQPFALIPGGFGHISPKITRSSLIDVQAEVRDSRLFLSFAYNRYMRHYQSSIQDWIEETKRCLESASTSLPAQKRSFTISDFPLLKYSMPEIETFNEAIAQPLLAESLEIEDAYKCSPTQDGIMLSQAKEAGLYMNRFITHVRSLNGSQVHPEKLEKAWLKVIERHSLLRAVIYESPGRNGHYDQLVLKKAPPGMSMILPTSTDPAAELEQHQFDIFSLGPQHRLAICASSTGHIACLLEIHHALIDDYSRQIILRDLSLAYEDSLDLTPARAYRDYVSHINTHPLNEAMAYWEQYLMSVESCNLPSSAPCPLPDKAGDMRQVQKFSLQFSPALRKFCAQHEVTLANVFQLAWALVLRLYLNSESACFGYMTSGRDVPIADIDDTVGPILNMHICRMVMEENEQILSLLQKCQANYVESLTHQHISILDKIRSTKISASALFNTIMSVLPRFDDLEKQSTLLFEDFKGANLTEYDLILHVGIKELEIDVLWEYSLTFISDEQVENIADAFQQALLSIVSKPHQSVKDVSLFGALNKRRVAQYNKHRMLAVDQPADKLIEERCLAQPSAVAVDAWDGSFTYEEINKLSSFVAAELRRCGIGPNKKVPVCFERSRWTPVALLGVLKAGAAFILLDTSHPIERLREICSDADTSVVLTSEQKRPLALQLSSQLLLVDEQIAKWENRGSPPKQQSRDGEDLAYLIFTSGSTGKPKGVMISHRALATSAISHGNALLVNANSRVLQFSSYAFDAAVLEHITSLIMGACICIPSDTQRHDIPKSVATLQATWIFVTPAVARVLNPSDLKTIRTIAIGGEAVSKKELDIWRNHANLLLVYGPTECTIIMCSQLVTNEITDGRNLGHCFGGSGWVVGPNHSDQLLPIGAIGELLIEGPIVATGYLNDAEKTAEAFIQPPSWLAELRGISTGHIYKTGDLVRYIDNGIIQFVGRKDLQVKLRGNRLELGEVESHLHSSFPDIRDAVAEIVKPEGDDRQPMLIAFVCGNDCMSQEEAAKIVDDDTPATLFKKPSAEFSIQAQLAEAKMTKSLPVYMVPTVYLPLQYMPLTRTEKLDRKKIRAMAALLSSQQLEEYDFSASATGTPTTTEEVLLQRAWAHVLKKDIASIGLHSNFFRMGGDSILAMTLISQVRDVGYSIKMTDIFNHPKLVSLAAAVHQTAASTGSIIAPFTLISNETSKETLVNLAATQCGIPANSIEDVYPTTPLQEGLVALAAKRPGQYIVTMNYELSKDVELDKFVAAWNLTVAANAILRTRVIQSDSLGFLQVVVHDSIPWKICDNEEEYDALIEAASMSLGDQLIHFGLSQPRSNTQECYKFHLTIHHAIYDGGSLPLLWNQVQCAYREKSLSPHPFNRFIEHVLTTEGAGAFWKSEFEGLNAAIFPSLPSPLYVPDPSSCLTYTMSAVSHQAANYTRTTAIRLAWAMVMSCYTDTEDIVYGVTVNGRSAPMEGIEDITGPTFATFPVRTQVCQSLTVKESLASIQEKTVAAMPFQHFGMQNIRQLSADAAIACDFQCHLTVQAPRSNVVNSLVTDVRSKNKDYGDFASYALVIICHLPTEAETDIVVSVNYDKNIVEPLEATRMIQQFEHMLRQIELSQGKPSSESVKLRDLDLLGPEDRQQLATWNSKLPPSDDLCLHELVLHHAIDRPDAPAISAWDGEMTFKELDSASAILAQQLQSLAIQPKSLIPLLFDRSKWVVIAMTALHRIGAACVNIDPGHPKGRVQDIVNRTGAKFILTSASYRESMVFEGTTLVTVPIEAPQPRAEDLSAVLVSPQDVAFVIFTSGSTGKPKGILMEHGNLTASIRGFTPECHLDRNTRGLHFSSYAFDGSIYEIFGVLVNGGCICIPSESDRMNNVASFINNKDVNWAIFTPSYLALLEPDSIPSMRTILLGGEAVTQAHVATWGAKVNLVNAYGPAEATVCAVGPLATDGWKPGTIGHVTGGVGWVTLLSDRSTLAPIGIPGELAIEGAVVTRGYIGDPETTANAYRTDPVWLRPFRRGHSGSRVYFSGDIVQYNADGTIRYLGRVDNQVKLRGQRIELGEVEHHVRNAFPNVTDVVAEVVTPDGGTPVLIAFVANMVESPGISTGKLFHAPSEEFLAQVGAATHKISSAVPRYMIPAAFIPLSEIPRTRSDKANRRLLREEAAKLSQDEIQVFSKSRTTKRRPKTEQEKILQSLWARTFKVPEDDIGADDNFLDIGDSFAAIRLSTAARSQGQNLPVSHIFRYPILSQQARMMTALDSTGLGVEYRPGLLLGVSNPATFFHKYLSDKVPLYKAHDVEDIIPTTERQSAFIKERNVTYSRLHMSTQVDPRRLEEACRALISKHAILRTVFIPHRDKVLQVVLRDPAFPFRELQCNENVWEYSNRLCTQDASSHVPFGSLHFQATLISRSDLDHMFVIRMTHAQFDAGSIHLIYDDLASAYNGAQLESHAPSFAQFIHHRLSQDLSDVHKFWRQYLGGSRMTETPMLGSTPPDDTQAEFTVTALRNIPLPTLPSGITMASLAKAAWSMVLARTLKTNDAVFGQVINGRAVSLAGVDLISGPCITVSPFRVSTQPEWTIMDLLNHTQTQYTRSMPYSNLDFKSILYNSTSWSPDTDFGSIVTHQDGSVRLNGSVTDTTKWQWQTANVGISSHLHIVTSPASDGLWVGGSISSHKMHPHTVDRLLDEFCRLMVQFSDDVSQPLPLEPDAISDGPMPWLSAPTSIAVRPRQVWQ
ncbi:hypothetical protein F5B18DRAFT_252198 [Nemania serpens]|nr:hypothetical protein F5B18DRAFT_252198 [Nemania serpens]